MADFDNAFWSLGVAGLTLLSIVFCAVLLTMQSRSRLPGREVETTGHQWDGDLTELNNPLPGWWMYLFWITIVFSVAYLVLYPGLGAWQGTLGWSSSGQYEQERESADISYGPVFRKFATMQVEAIAKDPQAHAIGERLFLTYCSQCHGSDARGAKGFPNLVSDSLYGNDAAAILSSILDGRKGMMPSMDGVVGGKQGALQMANYVLSLSGAPHDAKEAASAKPKFAVCAACHGAEGKGNPQIGAPNLTDRIWLHGGSLEAIAETISKGRVNQMPAHRDFLGEEKARVLAGYVYGLKHPTGAKPPP